MRKLLILLSLIACTPTIAKQKEEKPVEAPTCTPCECVEQRAFPAVPTGFGIGDKYEDKTVLDACVHEVAKVVCYDTKIDWDGHVRHRMRVGKGKKRYNKYIEGRPTCIDNNGRKDKKADFRRSSVMQYCFYRLFHSSRYGSNRSKIDGTKTHERDMPAAHRAYARALKAEKMYPQICPWHVVNTHIPWPARALYLAHTYNERFSSTPLNQATLDRWKKTDYDLHRFGTRGDIDIVYASHADYIAEGCYDPVMFDRIDINIHIFALRALDRLSKKWQAGDTLNISWWRANWSG